MQEGLAVNELVNRTPSLATLSKAGVCTTLSPKAPEGDVWVEPEQIVDDEKQL